MCESPLIQLLFSSRRHLCGKLKGLYLAAMSGSNGWMKMDFSEMCLTKNTKTHKQDNVFERNLGTFGSLQNNY